MYLKYEAAGEPGLDQSQTEPGNVAVLRKGGTVHKLKWGRQALGKYRWVVN